MFAQLTGKQKIGLVTLAALCFVAIIIAVFLFFSGGPDQQQNDVATQRANTPIDSGITELLQRGVTSYQIDSIKNGLYKFASSKDQDIARMTIDIDSIDRVVDNQGEKTQDYASFTVKLEGKQYNVRAELPGMSSAQVIVLEGDDPVFDSGLIDLEAEGITR